MNAHKKTHHFRQLSLRSGQAIMEYLVGIAVVLAVVIAGVMPGGPLRNAFTDYYSTIGSRWSGITEPEQERRNAARACYEDMVDCIYNDPACSNSGENNMLTQCLFNKMERHQTCMSTYNGCMDAVD
jgi:hypothetical protein